MSVKCYSSLSHIRTTDSNAVLLPSCCPAAAGGGRRTYSSVSLCSVPCLHMSVLSQHEAAGQMSGDTRDSCTRTDTDADVKARARTHTRARTNRKTLGMLSRARTHSPPHHPSRPTSRPAPAAGCEAPSERPTRTPRSTSAGSRLSPASQAWWRMCKPA